MARSEPDHGMVSRLSPSTGPLRPAARKGLRSALDTFGRSGSTRTTAGDEVQHRVTETSDQLFSLSSVGSFAMDGTHNKLDIAAIRARLASAEAPDYWRSLEELALADEQGWRERLQTEFP